VEIDLLSSEEEIVGHVEKSVERADTGVGDESVDSTVSFHGLFYNLFND
jgi:hypothetical protein